MECAAEFAAKSEQVHTQPAKLTYTFGEVVSLYKDDLEPTRELKEAVVRLNLYKPHSVAIGAFKEDGKRKKPMRGCTSHLQRQGSNEARRVHQNVAFQRTAELSRLPKLDWLNAESTSRMIAARPCVLKPPIMQTLKKSFEDLRIVKVGPTPFLPIPTNVDVFHSLKRFTAEVTVAYNSAYFFVVPLAEKHFYQFGMEATFNRLLSGPAFAANYNPVLNGNFCCVRTAQLEFSRGYCYEFDARLNTAKVYFIDSGLRRTIRKECILPMPPELLTIPLLAAHCTLLGSAHPCNVNAQQSELSFIKRVSRKQFLVVVHWHSCTCVVPGLSIPSLCVSLIEEEQEKPVHDGLSNAAGKRAN